MPIFGATLENATLFFTYNFVQGQLRRASGMSVPRSSDDPESGTRSRPVRPVSTRLPFATGMCPSTLLAYSRPLRSAADLLHFILTEVVRGFDAKASTAHAASDGGTERTNGAVDCSACAAARPQRTPPRKEI